VKSHGARTASPDFCNQQTESARGTSVALKPVADNAEGKVMEDAFRHREHWLEEEYFRQREEELIRKIHRRRELQEATHLTDEEILDDLEQMGYTRETVKYLLPLVPLVQVAWSEGAVTPRQREQILRLAQLRGAAPDSDSCRLLTEWLARRPSDEFFRRTIHLLNCLLNAEAPEEKAAELRELLAYCTKVAEASGGILGLWGTISEIERATLKQIAAELASQTK
jgi:hypothetical protein